MTFTQIPDNLSSINLPLIYKFQSDTTLESILIYIVCNSETISQKRLYNTSEGEIDIAPILRAHHNPSPKSLNTTLYAYSETSLNVVVRAQGVNSESRVFLNSLKRVDESRLRSTTPTERIISHGEHDEIALMKGVIRATLEIITPEGSTTKSLIGGSPQHYLNLHLNTTEIEPEATELYIDFTLLGGVTTERLHYTFVKRPSNSLRVIWLSDLGSFERYTFPFVRSVTEHSTTKPMELYSAELIPQCPSTEYQIELSSAYEARKMRMALSEISHRSIVWVESPEGKLIAAKVEPTSSELFDAERLRPIKIKLLVSPENYSKLWN